MKWQKDVLKINFNFSCDWLKYESFQNKERWDIKHVMVATWHTYSILYDYYKKNLRRVTSESKHLPEVERTMVHNVLSKYELLFSQTLVTCKTKTLNIEPQTYAKPYHVRRIQCLGHTKSYSRSKFKGFSNQVYFKYSIDWSGGISPLSNQKMM